LSDNDVANALDVFDGKGPDEIGPVSAVDPLFVDVLETTGAFGVVPVLV
jgi:hypothetical protein